MLFWCIKCTLNLKLLSSRACYDFVLKGAYTCQDESNFTLDIPAILEKQRTFTFANAFGLDVMRNNERISNLHDER
jgi:hypothetical protein